MKLSGPRTRLVTLLKKSVTYDDYNQPIETWEPDSSPSTDNGKMYMEWWDQGGKEALESGQIVAVQDVRGKCRFIDGLTQQTQHNYRIEKDGVKYDIQNVKEVGRREGQILIMEARDND